MSYEFIEQYEDLRTACHRAAMKDPTVLGEDNQWLGVAFSNAGPTGIYSMTVTDTGIACNASCWTSQTGGSTEFIDFTVSFAALDEAVRDEAALVAAVSNAVSV